MTWLTCPLAPFDMETHLPPGTQCRLALPWEPRTSRPTGAVLGEVEQVQIMLQRHASRILWLHSSTIQGASRPGTRSNSP